MASNSPTSSGHLFQLIRDGSVSTRRALGEVTGLSRTTVTSHVERLLGARLIREATSEGIGVGRPAGILQFDDEFPTFLVADLGATHGRVAVVNAHGQVFAERVIDSNINDGPLLVLNRVCDLFDDLLRESLRDLGSIRGVGIGVPGPINFEAGHIVRAPLMPSWQLYPIREVFQSRFHAPVFVDNDANLMALGEFARIYPNAGGVVFIKVGTGIGAGLVSHGSVLRGSQGAEGDIGHVKIPGNHHICACGSEGCLASLASGRAILSQLREIGIPVTTSAELLDLLGQGQSDAIRLIGESGRLLGEVLATVVALVNPDVLVLGGDIGQVEHLRRAVHERLLQLTQPLATSALTVSSSELGDRAGILGGVELVKSQIYNADAIDELLDGVNATVSTKRMAI